MDALTGLNFRAPELLFAAMAAALLVVWFVARERARTRLANRFVAERLRGVSNPWRGARPYLLALGLALSLGALAGPRLGYRVEQVESTSSNRIFVLDVSNSMDARDVGTTRLLAAKALVRQLISTSGGRIALVVFEKNGDVVAPLTNDHAAVVALLESVVTGETAEAGSDLGAAIRAALALTEGTAGRSDVVVVSDGEDQGAGIDAAVAAATAGRVVVHTVMVGSTAGSIINTPNGPLRDANGGNVITTARPDKLQRIARGTGGVFIENPFTETAVASFQQRIAPVIARSGTVREVRIPNERYQWPLGAGLLALCLAGFANRGAD